MIELMGDRGFESRSLQQRVSCEPNFLERHSKSPLRNLMPTISAQPAEVAGLPPKTLSPLQQCAHLRDRVGIAFQAVRIL
jgi:hypothetical protein